MVVKNVLKYESYIIVGLLLAVGAFLKASGHINISSDWFWCLAGIALVFEGYLALKKQRQFDRKYKIIKKEEWEKIKDKL